MAVPGARFTTEPKMTVACVELKGAYAGVRKAMEELDAWVASSGAERAGFPFCMFFDNPFETPEAELRSTACIPIGSRIEPEGRFMVKEFPEARAAETRHEGPPQEFGKTYGPFLESLMKEGYSIAELPREYFREVADVDGPGSGFVIRQPVSKK